MATIYLIQKKGHVGNSLLWWAKNGCGYTTNLSKAEEFGAAEALKIQNESHDKIAHKKDDIMALSEPHINRENHQWQVYLNGLKNE